MTVATPATPLLSPAPNQQQPLAQIIDRVSRKKRRRRLHWALFALLVSAAAVALWLTTRPKPAPLSARFRSAPVARGDVVREVNATGHLEAITTVQVGSEVSGRIASVEVDYNDRVKAGQVLARFDRAALEATRAQILATLAAARATLEQAKTDRDRSVRDSERAEKLFAATVMNQAERDTAVATARLMRQRVTAAEAQVSAQEAAHSLAKTNLSRTLILSPIDGVVITRNVDPGQTVASMLQTPVLFTVAADLRKMRVIAAVDEADTGEVAVGQRATFTVNAYPSRSFEGLVTEVRNSPQIVQDVVTYGTVVEVDNSGLALKPGMTASVHIVTAEAKDVLRLPAASFQFTPPGEKPASDPGVWTLTDSGLRRTSALPGVSDGEHTGVAIGTLPVGARVVYELSAEGRKIYGIER
ncbi:MAG TPA: efflux RND transporter periplasmic adaptor subunit [Polyangiaceae bacterium]|nr:efflux RND transporter periplasmic adaptor subunit [Polyangiaceae bacterium]